MRERKYRVWDNVHGDKTPQMRYSDDFPNLGQFWLWVGQHEEMPVEDYIGLKDKNGKEIYEGDIVQNQALIDSVIMVEGVFTLTRSRQDQFFVKQPLAVHNGLEIIGNIHENPLEER